MLRSPIDLKYRTESFFSHTASFWSEAVITTFRETVSIMTLSPDNVIHDGRFKEKQQE